MWPDFQDILKVDRCRYAVIRTMRRKDAIQVGRIEVQVLVHATEDYDKVLEALMKILHGGREGLKIERTLSEGFHGNPITMIKAATTDASAIEDFLGKTLPKLPESDKVLLASSLDRHLEGGTLHLRLSKQAAYLDRVGLDTSDPIRVILKFTGHRPTLDDVRGVLTKYGLIMEK